MINKKVRRGCERCIKLQLPGGETAPARYRPIIDRFLCQSCNESTMISLVLEGVRLPNREKATA